MEVRAPDPFRTILGLVMNENKEAGSFPTVWKGSFSLLVMVPKYNTAPWFLHCNQLVNNYTTYHLKGARVGFVYCLFWAICDRSRWCNK